MSARRTRLSSKGFFSWLMATSDMQSHGLSCTVIFGPSAGHQGVAVGRAEAAELDVRALARMAATCADEDEMKSARYPSRYGLPLSQ